MFFHLIILLPSMTLWVWNLEKNGTFTTKSPANNLAAEPCADLGIFYKVIWKEGFPEKPIFFFLRLVILASTPLIEFTRDNLGWLYLQINAACVSQQMNAHIFIHNPFFDDLESNPCCFHLEFSYYV